MLDQALLYCAQGLSVFPVCTPVPGTAGHRLTVRCLQHGQCTSPGKVALVKWKPYQDERAAADTVRSWWGRWPEANIAMATGHASGAVVVDLDGDLATKEAVNRGIDIGPWAYTGRVGGRHIWCAYREDAPTVFAKVGGIDFRGQGGYVLLPPSLHHTGNRYRWAQEPGTAPLPELPRWINDLANEKISTNGHVLQNSAPALDISSLLLEGVAKGHRDDTLFRLAAKLRGMGVPYDLAVDWVERSAERCTPPFPLDQARAKVDSAYRRYEPNPEGSKPVRLNNGRTVDPVTGEVLVDNPWPEPENRGKATLSEQGNVEYVEDLIKPGRIVVWAAEEGSGKSYTVDGELAIRMVAAGGSLAGTWPIVGTHRVLVLSEMHGDDDYEREDVVLKSLNLTRTALDGTYWRLPLMTAAHGQPCLQVPEWCSWCIEWSKTQGIHLLIVDTATGATDVNPWGHEMQAVYRQLRLMLDAYPELAIVLIVHCKKPQPGAKPERRITDVLGEWGRWCDVIVMQERETLSSVKLTTYKRVRHMRKILATQKDGLLIDPISLDNAAGSKVPMSRVITVIEENSGLTLHELADLLGVSKRTASKYADDCEIKGAIYQLVGEKGTKRLYATAQIGNTAQ